MSRICTKFQKVKYLVEESMKEKEIEKILMDNTDLLGYPRAEVMRNVVFVPGRGRADVILLPANGLHRLVLIEVKRASASDAGDKVIGQLLKYYAHALTLGTAAKMIVVLSML
jgi:hypothetical protein